jgi:hypothetical protein
MTKVILNGTIKGLRGKLGNLIFRQMPDGTTVVTMAQPKMNSRQKKRARLKRSPAQKAHNSRFREAVSYARAAQVKPLYVDLAAVTPMKTAYNLALRDWWEPPVIHRVERREGYIRVEATDNIMVSRVRVSILDEAGQLLETGEGTRGEGDCWEFTSEAQGKTIIAEAWDLPGHVTKFVEQ